jgi:hypothetical protein
MDSQDSRAKARGMGMGSCQPPSIRPEEEILIQAPGGSEEREEGKGVRRGRGREEGYLSSRG